MSPQPVADVRPVDDLELVRRARTGDKDAFGELAARHGTAMYRYARRMLRDDGAAEDCMQDALVGALTSIGRFRGESAVRTWLFGILAHVVRRRMRDAVRHPVQGLPPDLVAGGAADRAGDPVATVQAHDLLAALELALADLPELQRACWILAEVERMSYADVARVQSTTVGAVRGAVHRARVNLERRLEPWR
ncbi:RNA polymerase sigma factor [Isoptericola sp. NPDC019693]|uniref:RNA polymerase sigma factor n=1 Tax=Isoptericola sp. NPDC019693 TaxID=3364009 RepID=UPI0037AE3544